MRRPFITDIGKVLCMDQTTATRNIGLLERAGFVAVGVHPDDARKKVVELTPEGQAKLEEAFPLWEEAQRGNQGIPRRRQAGASVLPASGSERFLQRMKFLLLHVHPQ